MFAISTSNAAAQSFATDHLGTDAFPSDFNDDVQMAKGSEKASRSRLATSKVPNPLQLVKDVIRKRVSRAEGPRLSRLTSHASHSANLARFDAMCAQVTPNWHDACEKVNIEIATLDHTAKLHDHTLAEKIGTIEWNYAMMQELSP